jgi:hypothetical protein
MTCKKLKIELDSKNTIAENLKNTKILTEFDYINLHFRDPLH